ncbi:hypothetical protein ILYODFUR_014716 [Ilyodon furcidens]|uniref:Chemokine interleukin-8-like domain-containing protein n=1 Tax=Ilyodon furcidens TaxID=33524 RepID=A0ABV0SPN4_9TELE
MSTLSYSRWIFLLSLTALMFISLSEVESFSPIIKLDCCQNLSNRTFPRIKQCYEQKRLDCNIHAFIIKNHKGRLRCIDPKSEELRNKIKKGQLRCPPDISSPE